jgi:CysZ protein
LSAVRRIGPATDRSSPVRDFVRGIGLFGRGLVIMLRSPRLLLIGAAPAVLTALLLLSGLVTLAFFVDDLATWITPFADSWVSGLREAVRVAISVALFGAALVVGVLSFSALTLAIGGPFYEHIAEKLEDVLEAEEGPRSTGPDVSGAASPPAQDLSWGRLLWLGIRDGVVLVLRSILFTVPLLVAGFVPVVGQTVVPVLLALMTAWFLALEFVAVSFYRLGMDLEQRRAVLSKRRALAVGFGLPVSLLCAVPLLAIVVMPVAFAGGVLLAHEALREAR